MKNRNYRMEIAITGLALLCIANFVTISAQTWTSIDGGGTNGINSTSSTSSIQASSTVYNDELYAIWKEVVSGADQIHIKKFNGSSWSGAGNTSGQSQLNVSTTATYNPKIITYDGNLYAAWQENDVGDPAFGAIHVKKFNGSTWAFAQTYSPSRAYGEYCLNKEQTGNACNVDLAVYNNELYAVWLEWANATTIYQVRASKFNGSVWVSIDGNGTIGLNFRADSTAYTTAPPTLAIYNDQLYVTWGEKNNGGRSQLRVRRYDGGSTWTFVDGNGATGLNYSSTTNANEPFLSSYNNGLYLFWRENNRLRIKQYDATNGWTAGPDAGTTGWVHSGTTAYNPFAYVYNNLMYIAWEENYNADRQIRVVSFNGTTKTFIDGDGTTGINQNIDTSANDPALTVYHGDLYSVWSETNGTSTQIRAKKYPLPPIVTSVSVPSNGTYGTSQNLSFTVNFNKAVTVSGTPYIPITLNTGGTVNATYQSGSGTTSLIFRYTVVSGNDDPDGIAVGSSIVLPVGCTIRDANSLNASLTLNSVGATTAVLVDGIAPSVSSINRQIPLGSQTNGNSVVYRVIFSKSVTGVDITDFTLTNVGSASGTISSVSASSGTTIDVTVNTVTGNGTLRLDLKSSGTGITDAAGNGISSGFASGQTYTIDHIAPSVSSINRLTPTDSLTSATNVAFRVTFSENVINVGTVSFQLTASGVTGTIASVSATYGSYIDVTVNSISGDGTLRLDLKSSGTGITDSAGNAISGGFVTGQSYTITTKPVVQTNAATDVSTTTATGNGNLTGLGASNPTSYGICWGTAEYPDTTNSKVNNGGRSSTGTFTAAITGLTPNTTYHMCAFAGNSYGISYGTDVTFTTAPVYTVMYNGNTNTGGTVPVDGNTYAQSATVTVLNNTGSLVKTGYSFAGWNTASNGSGSSYAAGGTFPMGTSNVILYAQWTIKKYTIAMTATNGSVGYSPSTSSYDSNTTVQLTATPNTGYSFVSWSGGVISSSNPVSVTMDADKTICANFTPITYTITYSLDGGVNSGSNPANYDVTTSTITLAAPSKVGHIFDGWFSDPSFSTVVTTIPLGSIGNRTLYAKWTIRQYTIAITAINGSVGYNPSAASYDSNTTVQLTATPGTGYSFANWSGDITSTSNPVIVTMNTNKTIAANFTLNNYQLTVVASTGGTISAPSSSPLVVNHGVAVTITAAPVSGYTFIKWSRSNAHAVIADSSAINTTVTLSDSATVTAVFSLNAYTLSVSVINGSVIKTPEQASYTHGSSVQLGPQPNAGYSFVNWSGDLIGNANPASITMDASKNISAIFAPVSYSISYNLNEGTNAANPSTYDITTPTITLAAPSKIGSVFGGWYVTSDFSGSPTTTIVQGSTGNVVLHAKWAAKQYSITITASNGSVGCNPSAAVYDSNATVQLTATAASGYSFTSWSGDLAGSVNPASIIMDVNKNITAAFTPISYSISYNLYGGVNANNPVSYDITTPSITLSVPSKTGFIFGGWYVTSDFSGSPTTTIAQGSTGNVVLHAKWTSKQYSISISASNGSVGCNPSAALYDSNATVLLTVTATTGYSFTSWSGDLTGNTNPVSITMDGNKNITATFSPVSYSISYTLNGGTNAGNPVTYDITTPTINLAAPSRVGYVFSGWYAISDFSGSQVSTIAQGSTGDIVLFAKWVVTSFNLTVSASTGGTITTPTISPVIVHYGEATSVAASPSAGYSFVKWIRSNVNAAITDSTQPATTITLIDSATVIAVFSLNLPSVPLAINPIDGFSATADSMLFIWNKSTSEVDRYCLKLAADSAMTTVLSIDSSVADTALLKKSFTRNKAYFWQVRSHNAAGWSEYSVVHKFTVQGIIPALPKECTVICNGIHGANGKIRFGLPKASLVTMRLFNAQGKIVRNVYSRQLSAGYHTADLELSAMSRGFYILEFTAGEYSVKKSFFNY
jgi:uncharacterized repeat protein (TIGR02543 family)